jgi:predicted DNA-binding transcriptional regulator AlpA
MADIVVTSPQQLRSLIADAVRLALADHKPAEPAAPPGDRYLTPDEAAEYLRIGRSTLDDWESSKVGFPARIRLGPKNPVYRQSELDAWALAQKRGFASG